MSPFWEGRIALPIVGWVEAFFSFFFFSLFFSLSHVLTEHERLDGLAFWFAAFTISCGMPSAGITEHIGLSDLRDGFGESHLVIRWLLWAGFWAWTFLCHVDNVRVGKFFLSCRL